MHASQMVSLKSVLKVFIKFTGKHLCRSHFFQKIADGRLVKLLKRCSCTGIFCEFCKNFNTFFTEHLLATAFNDVLSNYVGNVVYCQTFLFLSIFDRSFVRASFRDLVL